MTSKTYSNAKIICHDLRQILCRNYGVWLLGLIAFLLLIPFSTAGIPGNSIFNIDVTHQQMKFRFFLPELSWVINGSAVLFGLLLGIMLFRFLLDKKQTTTFFALGLKRIVLFVNRFLVGQLIIISVFFVSMATALGLNLAALGSYTGLWNTFWYLFCGLVLLTTIAFLLSSVACILAGTVLEAVSFGAALAGGVSVLCGGINALMKQLLWGNPFGVTTYAGTTEIAENLLERFASFNPILFFRQTLQDRAMFYRSLTEAEPAAISCTSLLLWTLVAVLLLVLAAWLFEHRKAEQAGISGLCPILSGWTIFLAGFLVFTVLFCFMAVYHVLLALAIAFLLFIFVCWLCSFLLFGRYRHKLQLLFFVGEIFFVLGLTGLIWGGWFGFAQRLPEAEQVSEVSCSYVGSPNYLFEPISGVSSGTQYYFTSDYTYTAQDEIERILQIHQMYIDLGKQDLEKDDEDMTKTVLPYDVKFSYTMKDGTIFTRYYDRASVEQLRAMLDLDETTSVNTGINSVITGNAVNDNGIIWPSESYAYGQIYLADRFYSQPQEVRFSDEKRGELLQAIADDVSNLSVQERYMPEKTTLGVILFSQDGENSKESFAYQLENTMIYLNEDYKNTLSFLQENDLMQYLSFRGEIESITLQKYDPYEGINGRKTPVANYFIGHIGSTLDEFWVQEDFGDRHPITQPERLQQLLPELQNAYFLHDEGYLAAVELAGEERYVYLYLPESKIPDFLDKNK